ncbi:MAG TPA: glycosyltransferase family 9 protein, partial [Opitutales bacterium]|nr:glycosyltransferase family 9 protein [Opitutales bacterium]
ILQEFLPKLGLQKNLERPIEFYPTELPVALENAILIFPHSRRAEKQWPYFNELTASLLNLNLQSPIVWMGTGELGPIDLAWPAERFVNLINRLPLQALPTAIAASKLVIANDSGPMHLAAAMGKEVLALFGPTSPKLYGPYPLEDPQHHILEAPHGELAQLSTQTVVEAILTLLSR